MYFLTEKWWKPKLESSFSYTIIQYDVNQEHIKHLNFILVDNYNMLIKNKYLIIYIHLCSAMSKIHYSHRISFYFPTNLLFNRKYIIVYV